MAAFHRDLWTPPCHRRLPTSIPPETGSVPGATAPLSVTFTGWEVATES